MTYIKRAILALVLIAGFSPAIAQVPAAVPALPDTERRTSYSMTASTCACALNFQLYGDGTDYQNWVEVFINGVRYNYNDASHGWTITSPSGSLSTLARPITNAVLTFNSAQTGTVQIVGARRPRRTSQLNENAGVSARNLNQVLTDLTAQNREIWDKTNDVTGRALVGQPGNTYGLLPIASACADGLLGFDATGLIPVCRSVGGPGLVTLPVVSGNLPMFSGLTGLLRDSGVPAQITPQSLGFKCDGSSESGIIQAAVNALPALGGMIYIPPGSNCNDSAFVTINKPNVTIMGASKATGNGSINNNNTSKINYSGTDSRYIDARSTLGFNLINVNLTYSSVSGFTGSLIDLGSKNPGVSIAAYNLIQGNFLGPNTNRTGTATLLNLSENVDSRVDQNFFFHGLPSILGQTTLGRNTVAHISKNVFSLGDGVSISSCGESWRIEGNSFEPNTSGQAQAFATTAALTCKGMVWQNNWFGDVTTDGGTWIDGYFKGLTFTGNQMAGKSGTIGTDGIKLNSSSGVTVNSNYFQSLGSVVVCNPAAQSQGVAVQYNFNNLAVGGLLVENPANCLSPLNTDGNAPSASQQGNTQIMIGQTSADPLPKTVSGDVTISAAGVTAIGANKVTRAMQAQGAARSVIGVTGNATANVADIQGAANQALVVNSAGTALAFGQVNLASSAAVTGVLSIANGGSGGANGVHGFVGGNSGATNLTAGGTFYLGLGSLVSAASPNAVYVPTGAGTFKNLTIVSAGSPGVAGQSYTATLLKNLTDTVLTCAIGTGVNTCTDSTNTASFASADRYSIRVVATGSAATTNILWSADFYPTP